MQSWHSAFLVVACVLSLAVFAGGAPTSRPAEVPASRGGADLVGGSLPELKFERWVRKAETPQNKPAVTLYRWWTNTCPFCESSLPAIEALRTKYAARGLRVVAVYHPKPPRDVDDKSIRGDAERIGYHGPIALDQDWSVLRDLYLDTGRRTATSASFLVDAKGVIRFVHPGPDFFPSAEPENARQNADHADVERAIAALLDEAESSAKGDRANAKSEE